MLTASKIHGEHALSTGVFRIEITLRHIFNEGKLVTAELRYDVQYKGTTIKTFTSLQEAVEYCS